MAVLNSQIGIGLPSNERSNKDISEKFPEWNSEKIYSKVGISNRFICEQKENSLILAKKAFKNLLIKIPDLKIDLVIYVSNSSQLQAPGDGHKFLTFFSELSNSGCLDVNLGCSGFTYAVGLANSLIETKSAENVLIITSDAYSKFISDDDKGNMTLFGDGSAACLVSLIPYSKISWDINDFKFGAYGSGYEDLYISNNSIDGIKPNKLTMNGQNIFKFTSNVVVKFIKDQQINLNNHKVIFHQANAFMLNYMKKKLKINDENFIISFEKYGNTVSSSIPIAISNSLDEISNKPLFLCGFGIGASFSSIVLSPIHSY
jgi:3-oxoacyl-[acyl-carrier-protein] synthase-3